MFHLVLKAWEVACSDSMELTAKAPKKNGGLEDEFLFGGSAYFSGQTVSSMEGN